MFDAYQYDPATGVYHTFDGEDYDTYGSLYDNGVHDGYGPYLPTDPYREGYVDGYEQGIDHRFPGYDGAWEDDFVD